MTTGMTRWSGRSPTGGCAAPRSQLCNWAPAGASVGQADITERLLTDERRIRRLLGALDDAVRYDEETAGGNRMLAEVWGRLAALLELRAEAGQKIGRVALSGQKRDEAVQAQDTVAAYKDVCEVVEEARLHPVGSAAWWLAITAALRASSDRIACEDRGVLVSPGYAPRQGQDAQRSSPQQGRTGREHPLAAGLGWERCRAPGHARWRINMGRETANIPGRILAQFWRHHAPGVFHAFR